MFFKRKKSKAIPSAAPEAASSVAAGTSRPKPAVLMVLDGFGVAADSEGNGVSRAKMPNMKKLYQTYTTMTLQASGEAVGLSWGEMGNSEVGHLAIGAGRVYYQTLPRINQSILKEEFYENPVFLKAVEHAKTNNSALHLVGLVSKGRVHSMDEHCHALLEFAKRQSFDRVFVHAILDGRDTLYNAGIDFVTELSQKMQELGVGKLASMSGRFFAMDRDNRWDRVEKAYSAMVLGQGEISTDPIEAIKASYAKEVYDEQFVPTVITAAGSPIATVADNDAVVIFNFRPDRSREITKAFVLPDFDKFPRAKRQNLFVVTMAEFEAGLPVEVAFPPEKIEKCLAEVISEAGLKQLHIAETEKYAHVTFFMNGTREEPFEGEDRVIIPSPRVASYDEAPEMSAYKVTDRVIQEINAGKYDLIIMNFANPDMVAHTGNLEATIKASEVMDECVQKIVDAALGKGGVVFLTADHGNAEEVKNLQTGGMDKEHSTNPVPFVVMGQNFVCQPGGSPASEGDLSLCPPVGMLADVAPTVLHVLGLPQPPEMTGQSLVQ